MTSVATPNVSIVDDEETWSGNRSSVSSVVDRLRASVAETARILAEFERDQEQDGLPDLYTYKKCCRQLVTFMATHMETSQDFVQQMDQVIRASYSNSTRFTLGSEGLWLRCDKIDIHGQDSTDRNTPSHQTPQGIKANPAMNCNFNATPLSFASGRATGLGPTCSPHVGLNISTPTAGKGHKRPSQRSQFESRQKSKRTRHTVVRNLYGSRLDSEEKHDIEVNALEGTGETATKTEKELQALEHCNQGARSNQLLETRLLHESVSNNKIVWPCSGPLDRNPAFIEHLKMAIKLVDAVNCCPPPEMKCTQECTDIHTLMCQNHRIQGGNAGVCHDKMCCIWRVIDTHLVRCQSTECEFKNRVGLRQALHDVFQSEMKLKATSDELLAAKAMNGDIVDAQDQSKNSHLMFESKIKRLEEQCAKLEDAILLHKDRERAFRVDLDENFELEDVPCFQDHYARISPKD